MAVKKPGTLKPIGRPKAIASPDNMLELFYEYRTEVKSKPFLVKDWVGKDAEPVYREKEKPLTLEGFENYLFEKKIISDISDYFENKDNRYADFVPVCRAVKRFIRQDQIEGGMAMIYNPSVTQRLNNLKEQTDVTTGGEKINVIALGNGSISETE